MFILFQKIVFKIKFEVADTVTDNSDNSSSVVSTNRNGLNKQKILLVFPNFRLYETFAVTPHQPSLSLGYLAGILKQERVDFKVIDGVAERLSIDEFLNRIRLYNPDYIGFTVNISLSYAAMAHALHIRKTFTNKTIVMGGPWAAAEWRFLLEKKYADIVVLGEGEEVIRELAYVCPKDYSKLKNVKGIAFISDDGKIINTGKRPLIDDLDTIPLPDWDSFPKKGYFKSVRKTPFYPLMTSRGCPYDCRNCTKIIHGYKLRLRSIENIIKELDYLKTLGCKEIIIEDDMFNFNLKRMKKLMREIIKRNYGFKFQLSNGIRADRVDYEFAKLLYNAGFYRAAVAVESGSPAVIKFLNKQLDLNVVPKAVDNLKKAGIKVSGYFILGLPVENLSSLIYSIDFANRLNLDIVVFLNILIFPGTKLESYIRAQEQKKKLIIENSVKDEREIENAPIVNRMMNYVTTPLLFKTENLTPKIVKKAQNYNLIRSFLNPKKFLRVLACYTPREFFFQSYKMIRQIIDQIHMTLFGNNKLNKRRYE